MIIDMRSDTVTKPSDGMRQAMARAEVGDDMSAEDPTVNRLEALVCDLLKKEAAVYACSGTQSNQMGLRAHCVAGDEVLMEAGCHIGTYECGAPAALSGLTCRLIPGQRGMLNVSDLHGKVRADNQHFCRTRLVCVENTTNAGGGCYYPLEQLYAVCDWAHEQGLKVHMDGARLFNAVIASGHSAAEIVKKIDTISICFSKGLGCPMGSILVGSKDEVYLARRARKLFGGALRQAGIVAASAVYALENNIQRLAEDHANAKVFANLVSKIDGLSIDPAAVQSNLVFYDVDPRLGNAAQLSSKLKEKGVRINAYGPSKMRACTHLDVNKTHVETAAAALAECVKEGFKDMPGNELGPYARG